MSLSDETKGMIKAILAAAGIALVVGIVIISVLEARRPEEIITTVSVIDEEQTEVLAQAWNPVLSGAHVDEERILLESDLNLLVGNTYRITIPNITLRLPDGAPDTPELPALVANSQITLANVGNWEGEIAHNDFAGERYRSGRIVYLIEGIYSFPIYQLDLLTNLDYAEFWAIDLIVIEQIFWTTETRITAPLRFEMTIGRPLLPPGIPPQVQYAIGLLLGAAASFAKIVLLERSINKAMGKGSKNAAAGSMRIGYASRYLLTAIVLLGGLFLMDFYGFVGAFVGTLTLTVAAYTAKIFIKRDKKQADINMQ